MPLLNNIRIMLASLLTTACVGTSTDAPNSASYKNSRIISRDGGIYSASGNLFVPRGINLQFGDKPAERLASIAAIRSAGANSIRLQLKKSTTPEQIREALDLAVSHQLVVVAMLWDENVTCNSSTEEFDDVVRHWTGTWRSVLTDKRYRNWLIINIANEWGKADSSFHEKYAAAIKLLRFAGYQAPLMIDAAHCGQDWTVFSGDGPELLLTADPLRSLIFSVHAYWDYQNASQIDAPLLAIQGRGYTFVWGEFGQSQFQTEYGHATDHRYLIRKANEENVGYFAWSWYGNGPSARILDMSRSASSVDLTPYGDEVINGFNAGSDYVPGIALTSVTIE